MSDLNQGDVFDLNRFLFMQDSLYGSIKEELRLGRKETHWMWFVFPQYKGLGESQMASKYAIQSVDEARAYLNHPVLGHRLYECIKLALASGRTAEEIFGYPDYLKFRSCLTLFIEVDHKEHLFQVALDQLCGGCKDSLTLNLLAHNI